MAVSLCGAIILSVAPLPDVGAAVLRCDHCEHRVVTLLCVSYMCYPHTDVMRFVAESLARCLFPLFKNNPFVPWDFQIVIFSLYD